MCNRTANINAAGVIIAATRLLEAKETLTHDCVCVCVCVRVVWQIEGEERRGEKRDAGRLTVISTDCMTSVQKTVHLSFQPTCILI